MTVRTSDDLTRTNGDCSSRRQFLSMAAVGSVIGLAGCTGSSVGSGSDSITIASLNPMSGAYSSLGPGQRAGVKLAVEQINESDEFDVEIEPVYDDTNTETGAAQQAAQRAVQEEGADFLFGAISSSVGLSLNEFAAENEVVYFAGPAAVAITGEACKEWVFRFETNTAQIAEAISAYTVNELGSNVWFHVADYAYGNSVYRRTRERMAAASNEFTEINRTASKLGASNFDSFVSQISNSDADVALLGMTGGDLINFVNQAVSQGLKEEIDIVAPTMSFQVVRRALGPKAAGTYGGLRYNASLELGDNEQFVNAFEQRNDGRPPDNFERVAYESVRLIARGADRAGSTAPADVRDALEGGTFSTVLGEVTLRESDHQATVPTWMAQMVPGEGATTEVEPLRRTDENLPPASELGCEMG